jgi:hypothetical protein
MEPNLTNDGGIRNANVVNAKFHLGSIGNNNQKSGAGPITVALIGAISVAVAWISGVGRNLSQQTTTNSSPQPAVTGATTTAQPDTPAAQADIPIHFAPTGSAWPSAPPGGSMKIMYPN